jgi:hypothetical protein
MKQSELKNLVRTLLAEALAGRDVNDEIADTEPSGQAKKKVEELFNGSMVVSFTDIEEIAYSYIKDLIKQNRCVKSSSSMQGRFQNRLGIFPMRVGNFLFVDQRAKTSPDNTEIS